MTLDRIVCELAGRMDAGLRGYARVFFLPFRRVRHILIVRGGALAADAAVDRVIRQREIVNRRDEDFLAIRRLDALGRNGAFQHAILAFIAEIRELERDDFVKTAEHG